MRTGSTNSQTIGTSADGHNVIFKDISKDRNIVPSSDAWSSVIIADKNGVQMGQLSQIQFPDGAVRTSIGTYKSASTNAFLNIQMNSDGTTYIFAEKTINGTYSTTQLAQF